MKNMIVTAMSIAIAIIIILIGFTIHGRYIRQVELDNAMTSSMENALLILLNEEGKPESEDEWKSIFMQSLAVQINSASDLTVSFLEADMEKGLLSVEATLTWQHPIGTKGQVSKIMHAIVEEYYEYD